MFYIDFKFEKIDLNCLPNHSQTYSKLYRLGNWNKTTFKIKSTKFEITWNGNLTKNEHFKVWMKNKMHYIRGRHNEWKIK